MTHASVVETFLILVQRSIFRYTSRMQPYKLFDHTADIGVEISGRTKRELFTKAAWSLLDILIERKEAPVIGIGMKEIKLTLEGSDLADLLVNFLRELMYLFNGKVTGRCFLYHYGVQQSRNWWPISRVSRTIKRSIQSRQNSKRSRIMA